MRVETVSTAERLHALAPEWRALVRRSPAATVFQTPEWLLPWWRHSGSGELCTLAFRDEGRLAGLLPAFLHDWEGRRQCTLVGSGPTDYLDLIAEPGRADECARLAFEALGERRGAWDVCDWQDLPPGSALLRAAPAPLCPEIADDAVCTEMPLAATVEEFEASVPHGIRRNVRRYGERLRAGRDVRFETARDDPGGELLDKLLELHAARWRKRGEPGMLAGREGFLRDATTELARSGLLRIHVLRAAGEPAGIIYQPAFRDRAYGYITGFDPELEPHSPGSLLLHYALGAAIQDGARRWDFLRGRERYKLQWGATEKPNCRLRLWANARSAGEVTRAPGAHPL